ncbi:HAMP domain-containing protein [Algoriphagus aestuariicola]|uniref:histidine kinase n=1 Tax=Algoriphagus aestuariicola TaxID=1852016 RepID=A0ABS3BQH5_9BACT|nr:ATP-binding protein [Algoriphagus aestuariicola]MBN7801542.1 HAMP domain-containing protein [Algoriphagus aestuariicola]
MKIKAKLYLSQFFLLGIIAVVAGIGVYYLNLVADYTAVILKDNYRTIDYMRKVNQQVDELQGKFERDVLTLEEFESRSAELYTLVNSQKANITEAGEKNLTENLSLEVTGYLDLIDQGLAGSNLNSNELWVSVSKIKTLTETIFLLNEETILSKSENAKNKSEQVIVYMIIIGASGITFGLIFFLGLPNYIVNPIKLFTKSIKEISLGNYGVQIPFEGEDELGNLAKSIRKMVVKLKEYEKSNFSKLIREQKRLAMIVNEMNEAILVTDENKNIILCNELLLDLIHLRREQVEGKHIQEIARINNLIDNITEDLFVPYLEGEEGQIAPVRIVMGGKERIFKKEILKLSGTEEENGPKKLMGHLVILSDITEFSEKDQAKLKFMSTLSHELKTPLAAIQLSTNLLENKKTGSLTSDQSDLVHTIKSNQERIKRMVNEVLDISQINQGYISLTTEHFSVADSIADSLQGLDLFLREKNIRLNKQIPENLPQIKGDYHKSVWIFNNLISNAIRYSPANSEITITASREANRIKVEVKDLGPGISLKNQERIFEHFFKLDHSSENGTGLGLAISKEFMEAMGGSIGVNSVIGKGAAFWVSFREV